MLLRKIIALLQNKPWKAIRSERQIALRLNGKNLKIYKTEMSADLKTCTFILEEEPSENPDGIIPNWQIDKSSKKSQKQAIKEWLLTGKPITPLDALEHFGCFRLGAYIFNLKKEGMEIDVDNSVDPRTGKRYATYRLKTTE